MIEDNDGIVSIIVESIQSVKGRDIVVIDTSDLDSAPADGFIVAHGNTPTQVSALTDKVVEDVLKIKHLHPISIHGKNNSTWVIIDFGNVLVNIFTPDARKFYDIEQLWSDGVIKEIPNEDA